MLLAALLDTLRIGGNIAVVGSASRQVLWPGDIDALATVQASALTLGQRLHELVVALDSLQRLRVLELKLGGTLEKPRRWTAQQVLAATSQELAAALTPDAKVKLDCAVFVPEEARFVELAVLYVLTGTNGQPLSWAPSASNDTIAEEARELAAAGDHYKALKRLQALWAQGRGRSTKQQREQLAAALNGPLAQLGQVCADLELLHKLCEYEPPPAALALSLRALALKVRRNPLVDDGGRAAVALVRAAGVVEDDASAGGLRRVAIRLARVGTKLGVVLQEAASKI
jgi:hypothetical protein